MACMYSVIDGDQQWKSVYKIAQRYYSNDGEGKEIDVRAFDSDTIQWLSMDTERGHWGLSGLWLEKDIVWWTWVEERVRKILVWKMASIWMCGVWIPCGLAWRDVHKHSNQLNQRSVMRATNTDQGRASIPGRLMPWQEVTLLRDPVGTSGTTVFVYRLKWSL